jgi:uncharacterized protein
MSQTEFQPFEDAPAGATAVRGYLHAPAGPSPKALVLTHGAGANCQSPLLVALAGAFCKAGFWVLRCDLPFRQLRPQGPPRGAAEQDQQGLRRAVEVIRRRLPGPVFLGGHSYGGRQASMLAASEPGLVEALLLLAYPLHPPKNPTQLRTAHFPTLRTPALFVHGNRDGFGSIDEMDAAREQIPGPTQLLPVEQAGHELITARNCSDLPDTIATAFARFLSSLNYRGAQVRPS